MNIITVGKRLIPAEQIALVEPFDPLANPDFKVEKDFKSRIVLGNRDNVLMEVTTEAFAEANAFRFLMEDQVALNPNFAFNVETFEPTESFSPKKPFQTRLKWRDREGNEQSKLLLTPPVLVLENLSGREREPAPAAPRPPKRPRTRRARAASAEAQ